MNYARKQKCQLNDPNKWGEVTETCKFYTSCRIPFLWDRIWVILVENLSFGQVGRLHITFCLAYSSCLHRMQLCLTVVILLNHFKKYPGTGFFLKDDRKEMSWSCLEQESADLVPAKVSLFYLSPFAVSMATPLQYLLTERCLTDLIRDQKLSSQYLPTSVGRRERNWGWERERDFAHIICMVWHLPPVVKL